MALLSFFGIRISIISNAPKDKEEQSVLNFIAEYNIYDITTLSMKMSLIKYYIGLKEERKAKKLLEETFESIKERYKKGTINSDIKTLIARIKIIKARLEKDEVKRKLICKEIIEDNNKTLKITNSVKKIHPIIQAYTCLNRETEVLDKIENFKMIGINNYTL